MHQTLHAFPWVVEPALTTRVWTKEYLWRKRPVEGHINKINTLAWRKWSPVGGPSPQRNLGLRCLPPGPPLDLLPWGHNHDNTSSMFQ